MLLWTTENDVYTKLSDPYSNPEPRPIPEAEGPAPVPAPITGIVSSEPPPGPGSLTQASDSHAYQFHLGPPPATLGLILAGLHLDLLIQAQPQAPDSSCLTLLVRY